MLEIKKMVGGREHKEIKAERGIEVT